MSFADTWHTTIEDDWNALLWKYWHRIRPENIQVEYTLNRLAPARIKAMDAAAWFAFLDQEYFVWKYTAPNRLATTRAQLRRYKDQNALGELDGLRTRLLEIDPSDIEGSLMTASRIRGLGIAGASGLLSLIYPEDFGTVDQFVVRALRDVDELKAQIVPMNPESLRLADGVALTRILREKAAQMNAQFDSTFWTPRTIDMALWAYGAQGMP